MDKAGDELTTHLFVLCLPGLEAPLREELVGLGLEVGALLTGGVEVTGPATAIARINLWSRLATRVLLRLGEVARPEQLATISLAAVRAKGEPVALDAEGAGAFGAAARKYFAPLDAKAPVTVSLRVFDGRCTVSADTSGEPLHQRGFRLETGKAPLRETLASGLLALAKWTPSVPLWDVMCGAGTIVIEAAEQAMGLAPGRSRHFAFERFVHADAKAFSALPRNRPVAAVGGITGSDLNAGALGVTRRNARRAGVLERLTLERMDATKLPARTGVPGLVMGNLPYGRRVNAGDELSVLYRRVGTSVTRALPGWRFAFFLEEGAEALGLRIDQSVALRNGGLTCQLVLGQL